MRIFFFILILLGLGASCSKSAYQSYSAENLKLDSTYQSDALEETISPYRKEVDAQMSAVIGYSDSTLIKYAPESPLGNFAADVVFEKGMELHPNNFSDMNRKNTIALLNFGGLRAPISKGDITVGNVYELMPFDNTITIVKLNPRAVWVMMEYLTQMNGQPVSNVEFLLGLGGAESQMTIQGQVINRNQGIYVITSDYLASGGDKMNFLKEAKEKWDSGFLIRDAFIEVIKKKQGVEYIAPEGRIKINN